MDLADVTGNGETSTSSAVVRSLGGGVASLGPAKGPLGGGTQQGILLLDSKPGLLTLSPLHDISGRVAGVGGDGDDVLDGAIGHDPGWLVGVAHD